MAKQTRRRKIKPPARVIPHGAILARLASEFAVTSLLVGCSGGKDATATLDVVCSSGLFSRVEAYFLYLVPGLSFQERYLDYLARRYSIMIHRLPHPTAANWLRSGEYRLPSSRSLSRKDKPAAIKQIDITNHLRQKTGIEWFATGEKAIDSIERNAMIRRVDGIEPKRRWAWPVGYWSHAAVVNHLKSRNIPLPPDYRFARTDGTFSARSFGSIGPAELGYIRDHYPSDFRKIVDMFPLLPAILPINGQKEVSQGQHSPAGSVARDNPAQ